MKELEIFYVVKTIERHFDALKTNLYFAYDYKKDGYNAEYVKGLYNAVNTIKDIREDLRKLKKIIDKLIDEADDYEE